MKKLILILSAFVLLTSFTDNVTEYKIKDSEQNIINLPAPSVLATEDSIYVYDEPEYIILPHIIQNEPLNIIRGIKGFSYLYQPNYCAFFGHNSYDFYRGDSSYNHKEYTSSYDSVTIFINNKYFIITPNEKGKLTITELSED